MDDNKVKWYQWFAIIPLFIWQLPQNIVALAMMPFLGKLRLISFKKFCWLYESSSMMSGISLGNFAFVTDLHSHEEAYCDHEQVGHTHDSKLFGPLYLFVIGLPSIYWAIIRKKCECYYNFFTEKRANKWAKLKTEDQSCGCKLVKQ